MENNTTGFKKYKTETPASVFMTAIENADIIEFNLKWSNGIGFFDYAVQGENAPKVGNGKILLSKTPGNRLLAIVGTRLGNVVVFTRFDSWTTQEDPVFVFNMPSTIKHAFNIYDGILMREDMELLLGDELKPNIGQRIEDLFSLCKKSEKK